MKSNIPYRVQSHRLRDASVQFAVDLHRAVVQIAHGSCVGTLDVKGRNLQAKLPVLLHLHLPPWGSVFIGGEVLPRRGSSSLLTSFN